MGSRSDLVAHHAQARQIVEQFRGRPVRSGEGGILATFDGPARAVRCATAIVSRLGSKNVDVRAGLHSGECEITGDDVGGVAVQIARRVASLARPGEVLVSQTVRDLAFGSAITFSDTGSHALDGIPGEWRVYAVTRT